MGIVSEKRFTPPRPFLKWAGGKAQLLAAIERHVPPEYGRYIEPFVGGGALFFHLRPKEAVLSDSNPELVNCYRVVRDNVRELVEALASYPFDKDFYYELRISGLCGNPGTPYQLSLAIRMHSTAVSRP